MNRSRPTVVALLTAFSLLLFAAAPAAHAAAGSVRVGAAPALPAGAQALGAAPAEQQLQLYVALEPRDPAALERFATEVATPGSPLYGQYLSVPGFAQRFGATPAAIAAVRGALAARGLEAGPVAANSLSLPVQATAAEAESAFGLSIDRVRTATGGVAFANDRAPALPAAAAPLVQGVVGLDDLAERHRKDGAGSAGSPLRAPQTAAPKAPAVVTGGPQPCHEALEFQEAEGGYTADQIASAYQLDDFYKAGNFGAGQTVALLEQEAYGQADIDAYRNCFGIDAELTKVEVEGGAPPYKKGDDGESALDIEQVMGLAPAAKVVVYEGPNPSEVQILSKWLEEDTAKVMSSSWGICEEEESAEEMAAMHTLLQEAAAQGQTFYVAAGDAGSTDCYERKGLHDKALEVDFPGSDPFATDVGGTRMEAPGTPPTEYIWDDGELEGAGGGGISKHFAMPGYQLAAAPGLGVIGPLSSGTQCGLSSGYCRQVPDVSANTSPSTGYIVHSEEEWQESGGTSAAAPLWAAFTALLQASPACGGHDLGFANPALYAAAGSSYATDFHDITAARPGGLPTTNMFDPAQPFAPAAGYDMATGIGTPAGPALGASLCALASQAPPPAPSSGQTGTPPAPVSPPPRVPHVSAAKLTGIAKGRPKLSLTVTARPGAKLRTVVVDLPPALLTKSPANALRFRLHKPRPSARFTVAYPALRASPKLLEHFKSGVTKKLGLVVATRETGNLGARLPLVLPLH